MSFKDYFSDIASAYQQYRPDYPEALFAYLASLCPAHDLAWDCATGSGQSAKALVKYFDRVIATDASAQQLANTAQDPKIDYRCEPAEKTSLRDHSVDLITVAQALHWFQFDAFYAEVRRVLKPQGLLAVWAYPNLLSEHGGIQALLRRLYQEVAHPYWPKERNHIDEGYRSLPFPFEKISTPNFVMEKNWTCEALLGYLTTWSGLQAALKAGKEKGIQEIFMEIRQAWPQDQTINFHWPLILFVSRI